MVYGELVIGIGHIGIDIVLNPVLFLWRYALLRLTGTFFKLSKIKMIKQLPLKIAFSALSISSSETERGFSQSICLQNHFCVQFRKN